MSKCSGLMNIKPPLNYYTFAGTLALLPNPAGREVTSVCDCCIRHTSIVLLMASTQTPSEKNCRTKSVRAATLQEEKSSVQRRLAHLTEVTSPLLLDLRNTSARSD